MFSQVDIGSFGSFTDLSWKNSLKDAGNNVQNFKRLNILYGRNYSGKTTEPPRESWRLNFLRKR